MRKTMLSRLGLLLVVAMMGAFAAVPMAAAQDPSSDPSSAQYNPPNIDPAGPSGAAAGSSAAGGADSGLNAPIGSLPFTGTDLLIVAGVALMLTGTGFALRRLSMPRDPSS